MKRAIVLTLLVLAGCAEPNETQSEPEVVTSPTDYSYNTSQEHVHDYWGEQEVVTVLDATEEDGFILMGVDHDVRLLAEGLVLQGTRTLNITVEVEGGELDNWVNPTLMYQSANDSAPIELGPAEGTAELLTTHDMHDLPHQQMSAWAFFVRFHQNDAYMRGDVTITMEVTAHRGLEIPPFPAHPDHWQNRTEILLFDDSSGAMIASQLGGQSLQLNNGLEEHTPDDGVIVPADAFEVVVELQSTNGALGLQYHGADSRDWIRLDAQAVGETKTYVIPVDSKGDGPYAKQSLWVFQVFIDEPADDSVFAGEYSIKATAYRQATV